MEDLVNDSYHDQRYNDEDSTIRKYKETDLYLLLPAIFPSDPMDTMDVRYLNYSHAHIVSPLKKALKIEMNNDAYFDKSTPSHSTSKDMASCQLDKNRSRTSLNAKASSYDGYIRRI